MFVDHGSRVVRFSMRPHVIEYRPPAHLPPLGDIVRDTLVKVTDTDKQICFDLPYNALWSIYASFPDSIDGSLTHCIISIHLHCTLLFYR